MMRRQGRNGVILLQRRKKIKEQICQWLNRKKARGLKVKIIRLDPAGANTPVEKRAETAEWKDLQAIDSEIASRDTHNNLEELSFPYIAGIARATRSAANIHTGTREKVAIEAIKCAAQLNRLVIVKVDGESKARDMHAYDKLPKWTRNMRTFGEAGIVK